MQQKVNSYIKRRGIKVDTSLRPNNSGYNYRIAREREDLNNGYTLRTCKECADGEIAENNEDGWTLYMYCYYDSDFFYVLYMPIWGE